MRFSETENSRATIPHGIGSVNGLIVLIVGCVGLVLSLLFVTQTEVHDSSSADRADTSNVSDDSQNPDSAEKDFPVTIRQPAGPPRVHTGQVDPHGNEVTVACSTCHATRKPNIDNRAAADLNEFHDSLKMNHGNISCLSCHNARNYDSLKLADGSRVEFVDVMTLCAQCHGPQMKDYRHGAHGGMNGHWDLSRGPRQRNNCVDCHNPHSPQFPKMQPTFKPKDRFLDNE